MRVALVAGEASGDNLGAGLCRALRQRHPEIRLEGVGGPAMAEAGCELIASCDELAVMGLVEVLRHLPRLIRLRRGLLRRWLADPPDAFVGIDAPDFNLGLERGLRGAGIPTAHYVSPSVWAWRPRRVRTVAASADLLLTLLPFEPDCYAGTGVDARFVGHPLADELAAGPGREAARRALGIAPDARVLALLPGSRRGEVRRLGPAFLAAADILQAARPELQVLVPAADPSLRDTLQDLALSASPTGLRILDGRAREVLAAADTALIASGTATLEAMLLGCPMVVAYRLAPLTHWILRDLGLLRIRRYALPNLLAGESLVPELMQSEVTPARLAAAVGSLLDGGERARRQREGLGRLSAVLQRGASDRAADAVLELVRRRAGAG